MPHHQGQPAVASGMNTMHNNLRLTKQQTQNEINRNTPQNTDDYSSKFREAHSGEELMRLLTDMGCRVLLMTMDNHGLSKNFPKMYLQLPKEKITMHNKRVSMNGFHLISCLHCMDNT